MADPIPQKRARDRGLYILAGIIIIAFFGLMAAVLVVDLPKGSRDIMLLVIGALVSAFTAVVQFFFGSSSGSKSKDAILADMAKRDEES